MAKSKWSFDNLFDSLFHKLCAKIPLIGKPISDYYRERDWFERFIKFGFAGVVTYWVVKAPITFVVTEYMEIHYLLSMFLVGLILTLLWFALSELWVWKKRR